MLLRVLQQYLELEETGDGEYLTTCAFHDDSRPSLSVNTAKKVFFCHACQKKGSVFELLAKMTTSTPAMVQFELASLEDYKPVKFDVDGCHERLLDNDKLMEFLYEERGWTPKVIEDLKIGQDGRRLSIPVYNIFGWLVNVRCYKPKAAKNEPKVINLKGCGKARIYLPGHLGSNDEPLYLVEGEPDCIAANTAGIRAVTSTAGAGHFNAAWAPLFSGQEVRVLYDTDDAGVRGAKRACELLARHASSVRDVSLADVLKSGTDLTDFLRQGGTEADLEKLAKQTKPTVAKKSDKEQDTEIYEVTLSESSQEKYYRKRVKIQVMVSGKTLSPYIVPKKVDVNCPLPKLKMCGGCTLNLDGGQRDLVFNGFNDDTLQLIETPIENHLKVIKKVCGIPNRCSIVDYQVKEAQNIEEAKVIPDLDFSIDDSQYVLRQVFYLGHGLDSNTTYEMTGRTIPHPKTQQVTYLIDKTISLDDSVTAFRVTDEIIENLRIFCVEQNTEEAK